MIVNREAFFTETRDTTFRGSFTQSQVNGITSILDAWQNRYAATGDDHWLAYELATVFHETAATMQPIAEWGRGAGRAYGHPDPVTRKVYYGRGYVQLTWKANYAAMSKIVGEDLVENPDMALEPNIAAQIMFYGMEHGTFTGRKLANYFTPANDDWINARRIINGLDCAAEIAVYGKEFMAAIAKAA